MSIDCEGDQCLFDNKASTVVVMTLVHNSAEVVYKANIRNEDSVSTVWAKSGNIPNDTFDGKNLEQIQKDLAKILGNFCRCASTLLIIFR